MSTSPGRRARTTASTRDGKPTAVASAALVAVAVVTVLMTGAGEDADTAGEATQASAVAVTHTERACPGSAEPRGTTSRVHIGSAPVPGLGREGTVRPESLDVARGRLVETRLTEPDSPAFVVEVDGGLAAGLFGAQVDEDTEAATLALAHCAAPASSWWFTGAGATLDHSSQLEITNVDPGEAVVDVRVFGQDGEIETVGTRGITIPAGGGTSIALTDVAPQGEELSVSVRATRGRVVAAMADSYSAAVAADPGAEWIPAQHQPRRQLRLAGIPSRAESRSLLVANPSRFEAQVELEIVGEDGSFRPSESSEIRVPPDTVVSTDVSDVIGREDVAVVLRSQVPVVGGLRSTTGSDTSYAAPAQVLAGPAAVPLFDDSRLPVSSAGAGGRAEITAYTADGREVESTTLDLAEGATATWQPGKRADYVVVTPTGGRIYGALSASGRAGVSQLPLVTLPIRMQQPAVTPVIR